MFIDIVCTQCYHYFGGKLHYLDILGDWVGLAKGLFELGVKVKKSGPDIG